MPGIGLVNIAPLSDGAALPYDGAAARAMGARARRDCYRRGLQDVGRTGRLARCQPGVRRGARFDHACVAQSPPRRLWRSQRLRRPVRDPHAAGAGLMPALDLALVASGTHRLGSGVGKSTQARAAFPANHHACAGAHAGFIHGKCHAGHRTYVLADRFAIEREAAPTGASCIRRSAKR